MKRVFYGVAIVLCYNLLYWGSILVWSFLGFATIGSIARGIDVVLRAAAIPFVLGGVVAFAFRERLQMWALLLAPFASSAALLIVTGMNPREIKDGVLGFFIVSAVAACAAVAGGTVERKVHLS
ncbi:MAG: hypothetical protein LAO06_11115 [Acidobacteriia bacterium]|nr:hypothetical protein [Terriglobia bacterium]